MTQVVLRLGLLMGMPFFRCDSLRPPTGMSEANCESQFESASKANTYGIAGCQWRRTQGPRPPEKGKANEAVIRLLAAALGIAADDLMVVSGHSSPAKVVAVSGMDDETIQRAFG